MYLKLCFCFVLFLETLNLMVTGQGNKKVTNWPTSGMESGHQTQNPYKGQAMDLAASQKVSNSYVSSQLNFS